MSRISVTKLNRVEGGLITRLRTIFESFSWEWEVLERLETSEGKSLVWKPTIETANEARRAARRGGQSEQHAASEAQRAKIGEK